MDFSWSVLMHCFSIGYEESQTNLKFLGRYSVIKSIGLILALQQCRWSHLPLPKLLWTPTEQHIRLQVLYSQM
uniref:Uncharacterized protein n=1 Tax=Anguilla anguilla TaxID=7936 RepID=A0A0E9WZJ5_ANGAN